jgi:FtsP/CotA-like multicopper oxidase with cupredoxin domain
MYHPMHVHGHSFTVRATGDVWTGGRGGPPLVRGALKDTVMVAPGEQVVTDFTADNPGQWLTPLSRRLSHGYRDGDRGLVRGDDCDAS